MTVTGPQKILYLTLGIFFLALGLVGLIIPIFPGIIFLAVAVYLLSRGSRRVSEYADRHPDLSRLQRRMRRLDAATLLQRMQVFALLTLAAVVKGIRRLIDLARK